MNTKQRDPPASRDGTEPEDAAAATPESDAAAPNTEDDDRSGPGLRPAFMSLGAGPIVLMLHGVGGGHRAFAPQIEALASNGYRAVAWDMPGYGRSAPVEPYTFKALADRCVMLIEALLGATDAGDEGVDDRRSVTLVGHSMGGMVAQEVVLRRPDLVSRLVLAGTTPSFGRRADGSVSKSWQQKFIAERVGPLDAGRGMAEVARTLVPAMVGPKAIPEGVALAQRCMAEVAPPTYRRALEALLTFDRRDALPQIHVPTLLICGEHDRAAPPAAMRAMAAALPHATLIELAGIGHLHNLEAPDEFSRALIRFLQLPRALH